MFETVLSDHFSGFGIMLAKSFVRNVSGVISACSVSTYEIARHVCIANKMSFNTNERSLNYLLNNDDFQIDDSYWRMHTGMVFKIMAKQELINEGDKIYIQVDFTSSEDNFLILCASLIVNTRAVPIYFTMRKYPKKKNQYDQKKMEGAFLRGLKHVLSKKYRYVIIADRGFGNKRFMEDCDACGFEYLIRMTPSAKTKIDDKEGILESIFDENTKKSVNFVKWDKNIDIYRHSNEAGVWYLASNIKDLSHAESEVIYKDRFKIEKCFQDLKSSGFNIEKSKIKKYANFKRLLAMCMVAHTLLVLFGSLIVTKAPDFLKNSAARANAILAYFQSEEKYITQ